MNRGKSQQLADKMITDMETLLDQIGLTKAQREAAQKMSEQLLLHGTKLRELHSTPGVNRSRKTTVAALGLAAIHAATVYRMNQR